jgi:hypothetical protein
MVGGNDVRVLRFRAFEFHHHQRQAVEKNQDVRASLVRAHHRELAHRQPLVADVLPIDQPRPVVDRLAAALVFHRHAIHQQAVNALVLLNQVGELQIQHRVRRRRHRIRRELGIDPRHRRLQSGGQHRAVVAFALAGRVRIEGVAAMAGKAHLREEVEDDGFKTGFEELGHGRMVAGIR